MKKYNEIKTFEEACKVQDLDPKIILPDFSNYPKHNREAMEAHSKLVIIIESANTLANGGEKWIPNWNDFSQRKYEPWFDLEDNEEGSSGFRYNAYGRWFTASSVGSRLCFINKEVCEYIAKQFIELYAAYMK